MRWRLRRLDDVVVTYRHRGAPRDEMAVGGRSIRRVERGWLVLDAEGRDGPPGPRQIPWHRILRIELDGRTIWRRERR